MSCARTRRSRCWRANWNRCCDREALAGKSTLNRLEHTPKRHGTKYHKIDCDGAKVDALLVDLFVEAHEWAPREIVIDLDNTDIPLQGV